MSKILKEFEARNARFEMIRNALREYEATGVSYAALAGFLESQLTALGADRLDSTEDLIRNLKSATKRVNSYSKEIVKC